MLLHSSASYGRGIEFNPLGSTKFHPFVVRFIVGEMLLSTLITFNNCIAPLYVVGVVVPKMVVLNLTGLFWSP